MNIFKIRYTPRSMRRPFYTVLCLFVLVLTGFAVQDPSPASPDKKELKNELPPFLKEESFWVDSLMDILSLRERVGQLFMVAAYSNKGPEHQAHIEELIQEHHIGGLIFFQGGPRRQARLTDRYQSISRVPLLLGMDAEWGLSMRLDSTVQYPKQMTLGAIRGDSLIYRMGRSIGQQCKRLGVHVNFAPVVDVNNNPDNPVINYRSFGENKVNVARKGIAYMNGLQDEHVLANAKHFPGHGDTDQDSHKTLPTVPYSRERLDSLELYPFRRLAEQGLGSMMVAHLNVPALGGQIGRPTTLSKPVVTNLLKEEIGFKGLVFTDALNMGAVSNRYEPGEVDLKALEAGNDVLLFPEDVPKAIGLIMKAIEEGRLSQETIDKRCRRILKAKYWVGLDDRDSIKLAGLTKDLNDRSYLAQRRELIAHSLTLLNNTDDLLPLSDLAGKSIASVVVGDTTGNPFQKSLAHYADVERYAVDRDVDLETTRRVLETVKDNDLVIISVHGMNDRPGRDYGIRAGTVNLVNKLIDQNKVVLDLFGNPYGLSRFYGARKAEAVIVSYEDAHDFQELSAQLIFGGVAARGKLPVTASSHFHEGDGVIIDKAQRLRYGIPEEVGVSARDLEAIDEIAKKGIENKAYPGCQVLVAKEGHVIYNKTFGSHTYEGKRKVEHDDLYDIASITKIVASTASLMYLQDQEKINVNRALCDYLPDMVDTCRYQSLSLHNILTHRAGLVSWIPFYKKTLHHGHPKYTIYSTDSSERYPYRVADGLFISRHYRDSIYHRILSAQVREEKEYRYSDLGYYLIKEIIERKGGMPMEQFVEKNFYRPLGLRTMGYLPRREHDLKNIVPTEYDMYFRKQLVHGDVHDPGAAMLGGVGGHAGVFSNANDLAVMMQMFLNWGAYGGKRYISEKTVKEFIRCQYCGIDTVDNRRGLGFDKPVRDGEGGPTCNCVSYESFGHSGFTGTIAWADPDEQVVYVFLSNRVYPSSQNRKLITMDIRTDIQQVIYNAINNGKELELTRR